jgi:hypothetical protein
LRVRGMGGGTDGCEEHAEGEAMSTLHGGEVFLV